jgi:hypothetical protein
MSLGPEEIPITPPFEARPARPAADITGLEVGDPFAGVDAPKRAEPPASPREAARPPAPPPQRTPPRAGGGGLDDLFGMGAGDNTRIRIPKRDEAAEARPRRPTVVSEAEANAGGVDRRPPLARPPVVTPQPSPRPMPPPDVLPDE